MLFGSPDRVFLWPGGPRQSTLERWYTEGMPRDVNLSDMLGLDRMEGLPIDFMPVPRFEQVVLEDFEDKKIWIDELGAKRLDFKTQATPGFVTRTWLEFPVKNRADFERMKERFDPHSSTRLPTWWDEKKQYYQERDFALGLTFPSMFWRVRDWVGLEGLCEMFYDNPALVRDMMEFVVDFDIEVMRRALPDVAPDYVFFNEDMAYKGASLISPKMVREFMLPGYKRLASFLKKCGVPVLMMDCDGYIGELIPIWLEAGLNATWPIEIAAGNDPILYRKQYGKRLAMGGAIDKRELARDKAAVEREIMSKAPWLLQRGGYIPACDHGVPPDVPYENYLYMIELIKRVGGA